MGLDFGQLEGADFVRALVIALGAAAMGGLLPLVREMWKKYEDRGQHPDYLYRALLYFAHALALLGLVIEIGGRVGDSALSWRTVLASVIFSLTGLALRLAYTMHDHPDDFIPARRETDPKPDLEEGHDARR